MNPTREILLHRIYAELNLIGMMNGIALVKYYEFYNLRNK